MSLLVDVQTANQSDVNNNKLLKIIIIKEKKIQLRICVFKKSCMFSHNNNAVQNIAFILYFQQQQRIVCCVFLFIIIINNFCC